MKDLLKVLRELAEYVKKNRKLWLIPVIIALFIIGFLIATAGSSPVPVFVYPLA
jgi:hypothetical protein